MVKKEPFKTVRIGTSVIEFGRADGGVVHILADDVLGMQRGLGFAHATDRLMQMFLTRTLSEGKLTEYLFDTEEAFGLDFLIRKLGLHADALSDFKNLSDETIQWCQAYCDGVNSYLEQFGPPAMCRLLNLEFRPWTIEDTMQLIKMHIYLGLAQQQERIERMIIQAVKEGVDLGCLRRLFQPHLDQIDSVVEVIRKVKLIHPFLNLNTNFEPGLSNNWAVSGKKSKSGKPLCANDPHLQVNRLPAIWYEAVLQIPQAFYMGATTPGFPGLVMGRSSVLSLSFTYGMMDTIDFFIEEIKEGAYRREKEWIPLNIRYEIFERKKKGRVEMRFFETDLGVVEKEENHEEDGYYLCLAWSSAKMGASAILNGFSKLWSSRNVFEAGEILRTLSMPANWVMADIEGNIAYQQSGRLPKRLSSGLLPLPAWRDTNRWQGWVDGKLLSCSYNPDCGFVASANDDKNQEGKPLSITVPFASYRYERIERFLSDKESYSLEDMKNLQSDLYSLQAEKFLSPMRDWIPVTSVGKILKDWDCCYRKDSQGAAIFETFYSEIQKAVFSKIFGSQAWEIMTHKSSLFVFMHGNFDSILLSNEEGWYAPEGKKEFFKKILELTLEKFSEKNVPCWGEMNVLVMKNLLFDGRLPRFMGFDLGPYPMEGNRATVAACHIFNDIKRPLAAAASYRFITDMGSREAYTILAGGVSENRFSKYYSSDVSKWLNFKYKKLKI